MKRGYLIVSSAVGVALIAAAAAIFFLPQFRAAWFARVWLDNFYAKPGNIPPFFAMVALCLAASLVALLSDRARRLLSRPVVFALVFSAPFFFFRFNEAAGDSEAWVNWIGYRYFMSEPGSLLLHHLAYRLLHRPFNLGAVSVIGLTGALAGFFTLWVLGAISNRLFDESRPRLLFRLVVLFSGVSLLFFGYLENTPLLVPLELLYILFMVRYLQRDRTADLAWAALALSAASIVHGSVCFVLPSLFLVLLARPGLRQPGRLFKLGGLSLALYVVPIVLFVLWVFFVDRRGLIGVPYGNILGGGDGHMFVPLSETAGFGRYTIFSRYHWYDMLNVLFAGAGGSLVVAAVWLVLNSLSAGKGLNPILYGYALSRFIFLFLWNCDWGFWQDWDLMIANALPFLLIAAFAAARGAGDRRGVFAAIPFLLSGIMVTGMFFLSLNGKPPATILVPSLAPLFQDEAKCAGEGLTARYYRDRDGAAPAGEVLGDVPSHIWGRKGPTGEITEPPFGVVWDGYLKVPRGGRHRFFYVVETDFRFSLNGRFLDGQWGKGGKIERETEVRLSPGLYRFTLEFYSGPDFGAAQFFWECAAFDKRPFTPADFCRFADFRETFPVPKL